MQHTPAPWKVYYAKNNGHLVLGLGEEDGSAITNHSGAFWGDDELAKANSEFVVKCVNNHHELLEALELLYKYADDEPVGGLWYDEMMAKTSQAITRAKGE